MKTFKKASAICSLILVYGTSWAAGMAPETSVILIDAGDGEGSINVKNTDSVTALLYTSIENIPEDEEELLLVTSPISRVEPGQQQLVRFVVQSEKPIVSQRLKRVAFEGIPPKDADGKDKVSMGIRQNLPAIISPSGLPDKSDPWTLLEWSVNGNQLTVRNDSRYVVRLSQAFEVTPSVASLSFAKTYILPGRGETFQLPPGTVLGKNNKIRLYPASAYGYQVNSYDAPLILN